MSRRIQSVSYQSTSNGSIETYFDRVVKYIPADVVAAWTFVSGLIAGASDVPKGVLLWLAFVFGTFITALWTWQQTKDVAKPPATTQIVISTLSFICWVFALGGPFAELEFYRPLYGSLVLVACTLLFGAIRPGE